MKRTQNYPTENATKARVEKGKRTSEKLIELIRKSTNGLTIYDLHKQTGLSCGACLKAIQRSKTPLEMKIDSSDGINIKKRYTIKTMRMAI